MTRTETPWGGWEPASLTEVASIFAGEPAPWWIAGGYAIELAVGRAFREHGDVDVLVLRRDQLLIQRALPGWQWHAADPPGILRPWRPGEVLPPDVHDIWCRPGPDAPWRIQFMLDESAGDEWVARRDPRIRRPLADLGRVTSEGIPYLAPEIQLFYKARGQRRKDETDFAAALPVLDSAARQWLYAALSLVHGEQHPWCARLVQGTPER
jgi:hypothetical protein